MKVMFSASLHLAALTATLFLGVIESGAATRTWSGLTTNTSIAAWSDTNNWVGNLRPASGDDVVFPSTGLQRQNFNDFATSLHEIVFADTGYIISGDAVTLTGGVLATNSSGINVFSDAFSSPANFNLGANVSITNRNASSSLALLTIDLEGKNLVFGGAGTNSVIGLKDSAGGGTFTNAGTGTFLFFGTNTSFSGPMALVAGTNLFLGIQQRSPVTWTAGTLGGTGTLGKVTVSGATAKQLVAGYLGAGNLTISNLVLDPSVTVAFRINGTNFQTDYGHITIGVQAAFTGATLGSATLSVSFPTNFYPPIGTTFTLFQTDTHSTISGIFTNLPDGSTITNSGVVYQLSYNSGHSVTLTTAAILSTGVTKTWSGGLVAGDGTEHWTEPLNWSGHIAPQPGDALLFRVGTLAFNNSNDFSSGTTFDSIHFQVPQSSSSAATARGNALRLNTGVQVEPVPANNPVASGVYTVSNLVTLNQSQTFSNAISGTIIHLAGGVDLGASTLTAIPPFNGSIDFDGTVTGTGSLVAGGSTFVTLTASNAITGSIEVSSGGRLEAVHGQALGFAQVHVSANGELVLQSRNSSSLTFTGSSILLGGTLLSGDLTTTNILAVPVSVEGSNALIDIDSGTQLVLSSPITNSTQLTLGFNSGTVRLPPGHLVTGGGLLNLQAGASLIADAIIHNTVRITNSVANFCTLSGSGQIDQIISTNNGVISPGFRLGVGTLLMRSNSTLAITLSAGAVGNVTNTSLVVTNSPTLGNARLGLTTQTNLTPNQQFTILQNLSSAPVTNTFLNLPEGAMFMPTNGNLGVRITYLGGTGNDVVLTVLGNQPPVFAAPTNTVFFNATSNNVYTNVFSDLEQAAETYTWTNLTALPSGLVLSANSGVMSWTPAANQGASTNIIVVKVTDSGTPPLSATGQVTIVVRPLNQAPVPVQIPNPTNVVAGHTLTIQLQANDPDNPPDAPIWGASSLPAGATLTTNGLFTYTTGQFQFGTNNATVFVYDFNPNAANPFSPTNFVTFTNIITRNRIVINTNNAGPGSLSNAIVEIGTNTIGGHIEFNIPGAGPFKIAPPTPLPGLAPNTYLDGYSQPGASPNTNVMGTGAKLMIELSGEAQTSGDGLTANQSGITIRGLCINRFVHNIGGIVLSSCCGSSCGGASGIAIEGCFVGTDPSGTVARPNAIGVYFGCMSGSRIGGPDLSQRNLIAGNQNDATQVGGHFSGTSIQNNLIGTDRTGTNALGNGGNGVSIGSDGGASGTLIADNVISANAGFGLRLEERGTTVVRNKIGVGADGVTPLGDGSGFGAVFANEDGALIGGTNIADGNVIANSPGAGIYGGGIHSSYLGNSIFHNSSRGIFVNLGANNNQSAPVLTSAVLGGGGCDGEWSADQPKQYDLPSGILLQR